jgi:hypothetical protein
VADSCEIGNDISGSMTYGWFLDVCDLSRTMISVVKYLTVYVCDIGLHIRACLTISVIRW